MSKKYYNFVYYALVLVFAFFAFDLAIFSSHNAFAKDNWTSHKASTFSGGSGTSSNPYKIETAAELAYLQYRIRYSNSTYTTKYYRLENNIDLTQYYWTPIGTSSYKFKGNFDGNGYIISGINCNTSITYVGLFGYIYDATITDTRVATGTISGTTSNYVGGIVGYAYNSDIEYSSSGVLITSTSASYVGGIVGYAEGTSIYRVYNEEKVQGSSSGNYVGGIAGYLKGSEITYAYNTAEIRGNDHVGGITGYFKRTSSGGNYTIEQTYNIGQVYGSQNVGGITGYLEGYSKTYKAAVYESYNEGRIRVSSGTLTNAGGIVGYLYRGIVEDTYNEGLISESSAVAVGGIVGRIDGSYNIEDNSNSANITGNRNVGGIVGVDLGREDEDGKEIEKCLNAGDITANDNAAGGIIGKIEQDNDTKFYLRYNGNEGKIKATNYYAGGIVGAVRSLSFGTDGFVEFSYNSGRIESKNTIGGIVGAWTDYTTKTEGEGKDEKTISHGTHGEVDTCYNTGIIAPSDDNGYAGGIVGKVDWEIEENEFDIKNSKNYSVFDVEVYDYAWCGTILGSGEYWVRFSSNYFSSSRSGVTMHATGDYSGSFTRSPDKNIDQTVVSMGTISGARYSEVSGVLDSSYQTSADINDGNPYFAGSFW